MTRVSSETSLEMALTLLMKFENGSDASNNDDEEDNLLLKRKDNRYCRCTTMA